MRKLWVLWLMLVALVAGCGGQVEAAGTATTVTSDIVTKWPVVDVRAFGIKGDGVTDNATNIGKLYRYIEAQGGGHIHFPKGVYATSKYDSINADNVTITADEGGVLKALNSGTARHGVLQINSVWDDTGGIRFKHIRIENLTIDMSDVVPVWLSSFTTAYGWGRGALWVRSCDDVIIRGCTVINGVHAGISAVGCFDLLAEGNRVFGLKAVVVGENQIMDGNAFNFQAYSIGGTPALTYAGAYGHWKIVNNIAVGQWESMPPTYTYNTTNRCNIGFHVEPGGWATDAQPDQGSPIIFSGNTVSNCWYGIVFEGQNTADIRHVKATSNVAKNCVFGLMLYPDAIHPGTHSGAAWVDFSHNEVIDSYAIGIMCKGQGLTLIGNTVREYAMAKSADRNTDNVGWLRLPADGGGIYISPVDSDTATGTYQNIIVSHNIVEKKTLHDTSYLLDGPGIEIDVPASVTLKNVDISNNILDGKGGFTSYLPHYSGISVMGQAQYVSIESNIITGFPGRGIYFDAYYGVTDYTKVPAYVNISRNTLKDNGTDGNDRSAMFLRVKTSHFDINDNTFQDTRTPSYTWTGIEIPQISAADVPVDYLRITGNKAIGLKYNNTDFIHAFVTGYNVKIADNWGYNYRTAAPSSVTVKYYKGTFVKNENMSELGTAGSKYTITGWDCITTGSPGTWLPRHALTGN